MWLAKWVNYSGAHPTNYTVDAATVSQRWGSPECWQFSDSGNLIGISGKVDLNYWYKELPQQ